MSRLRSVSAVLVLTLLIALGVGGCGSSSTPTSTTAGNSSTPSSSTAAAGGRCASAGTRHFQKTRLLADLGLAYGAFHRYLYKPYQAGAFRHGAPRRTLAIIKATGASAAIAKLMKNATANAQADPTLCKYVPSMSAISSTLSGLGGQLAGGGVVGGLAQSEGLFAKLKSAIGFSDSTNKLPGIG
jgi:hypothetical protein